MDVSDTITLVGRERELRVLRSELAEAGRGSARLAFVVGEPGIGKTHTILALAARAAREGTAVAWGRAHEGGAAPLYWPWTRVLGALAEACDAPERDALEHARQALRADVGRGAGDGAIEAARFALYDRVVRAIADAARARPALLVLDDLHWADVGSLQLLEFAARELLHAPVLVVATLRDGALVAGDERARILASLMAASRTVALGGLPRDDVAALLARRLDAAPEADVVDEVRSTTGGNPFLVLEVANLLSPSGERLALGGVPPGARALLQQRLDGLPERERRTLEAAAVVGVEFDLDVLAMLLDEPEASVRASLASAGRRGFVREVDGVLYRHAFAHALLRETLYEQLPAARRIALHAAVVRALEAQGAAADERLATLAHHAFEAARGGDAGVALRHCTAAGEHALARLAFDDAISHFERALAAQPHAGAGKGWALFAGLGQALHVTGHQERARAMFARAVDAARAAGPTAFASAVLRVAASAAETLVQDGEITALLEEALAGLPPDATPLRAFLLARLAWGLQIVPGARARARRLSDEAADVARALGNPRALEFVLTPRLRGLLGPDDADERRATIDEILRLDPTPSAELDAWLTRIGDLAEAGDRAGLDAAIAVFARASAALGMPYFAWAAARFDTAIALLDGRLDDAESLAARALELGGRVLRRSPGLEYAQQMFLLRGWQDRLEELAPALAAGFGEAPLNPAWRCAVADFCSVTGRVAEARRELDAIAASGFDAIPREGAWLMSMSMLAGVCARIDARPHAEPLYELLLPYRDRIAISRPLVVLVEPVELSLAKLAETLEWWSEAEAHLDRAAKRALEMRAPLWQGEVLLHRGVVLGRRGHEGDRAAAAAALDEAESLGRAHGMRLLVRWVAEARSALAVDRAQLGPAGTDERTARARVGVFREEGEMWTLAFESRTSHLRPMVGLSYIAALLAAPGRAIHAAALVASAARVGPRGEAQAAGDAGEHLDAAARAQYERRRREAREALAEAERCHDLGRAESLRFEVEMLEAEVARAVGLGGRARRAGSAQERARVSVTRAIKYAIDKIAPCDPALAEHLRRSIRTGTFASYEPASRDRVDWRL